MPKNHISALVPVLGNVALVHSTVCCLSGEKPTLNVDQKTLKMDEPTRPHVEMEWLRVTIVLHYVEEKRQMPLRSRPALAGKLLGCKKSVYTKEWELPQTASKCISGSITVEKDDVAGLLRQSGQGGVFVQQLAENIVDGFCFQQVN